MAESYRVEGGEGGVEGGPAGEVALEGPGEEEAHVEGRRVGWDHEEAVLHHHEEEDAEGEEAGNGVPMDNPRHLLHGESPGQRAPLGGATTIAAAGGHVERIPTSLMATASKAGVILGLGLFSSFASFLGVPLGGAAGCLEEERYQFPAVTHLRRSRRRRRRRVLPRAPPPSPAAGSAKAETL